MNLLEIIGALFLLAVVPLVLLYGAFRLVAPWLPAYKAGTLATWQMAILLVALAYDVFINRAWLVVLLWDKAQERTVTARMDRYVALGSGWRFHLASVVCAELNRRDPNHCNC